MAAPTDNVPLPYNLPDGLKLAFGILVIGLFLEVLNNFSPRAAYSMVALILLGYAAVTVDSKGTLRISGISDILKKMGVAK